MVLSVRSTLDFTLNKFMAGYIGIEGFGKVVITEGDPFSFPQWTSESKVV